MEIKGSHTLHTLETQSLGYDFRNCVNLFLQIELPLVKEITTLVFFVFPSENTSERTP
jgi:hypothetical protein